MLPHEAVDDAARRLPLNARVRPWGRSRRSARAVRGRGAGFRCQHQGAADLRRRGAGAEHGGDGGAVDDPAGGDERESTARSEQRQQGKQPVFLGLRAIGEEPRCPPASNPCATSASAPAACACAASSGLVTVTHTSAPAPCRRATGRVGAAERERHDRGTLVDSTIQLGIEVVVVVARLAEGDAVALGLSGERSE